MHVHKTLSDLSHEIHKSYDTVIHIAQIKQPPNFPIRQNLKQSDAVLTPQPSTEPTGFRPQVGAPPCHHSEWLTCAKVGEMPTWTVTRYEILGICTTSVKNALKISSNDYRWCLRIAGSVAVSETGLQLKYAAIRTNWCCQNTKERRQIEVWGITRR